MNKVYFIFLLTIVNISCVFSTPEKQVSNYFEDFFNQPYFEIKESEEIKIIGPKFVEKKDADEIRYTFKFTVAQVEKVLILRQHYTSQDLLGNYKFNPKSNTNKLEMTVSTFVPKGASYININAWVKTVDNKFYYKKMLTHILKRDNW